MKVPVSPPVPYFSMRITYGARATLTLMTLFFLGVNGKVTHPPHRFSFLVFFASFVSLRSGV